MNTAPELDPKQLAAIEGVKAFIAGVIADRDARAAAGEAVAPSAYWRHFCLAMEYLRDMPAAQFKSLRLHTYHVDAETYQGAFFGDRERYVGAYRAYTEGLAENLWLGAPAMCGEFGHLIDGRLVNDSILRWQELIQALWNCGVLPELASRDALDVLEIGGGYGALAHHLSRLLPRARYTIVDLPETLLLSASYLTLLHGPERVALVRAAPDLASESASRATFLLLPNHGVSWLQERRFDLAINIQSFQEMTAAQLETYLSFIAPRTSLLLSDNQDRQHRNRDSINVSAALRKHATLQPLPRRSGAAPLSLMKRAVSRLLNRRLPVRRFIARPRRSA